MAQVFTSVPLAELEVMFKSWIKEAQSEVPAKQFIEENRPEYFLTINEAAEFLNLKPATVYAKVSRGELPVMKPGKQLYFSTNDLIAYLKRGKRKSLQEIEDDAETYFSQRNKG